MSDGDNCIPDHVIPTGWRFVSCNQSAAGNEWWVQLEGPERPLPIRTAEAWGPTLRVAVERAAFKASL